jgi:hypothetical protein
MSDTSMRTANECEHIRPDAGNTADSFREGFPSFGSIISTISSITDVANGNHHVLEFESIATP